MYLRYSYAYRHSRRRFVMFLETYGSTTKRRRGYCVHHFVTPGRRFFVASKMPPRVARVNRGGVFGDRVKDITRLIILKRVEAHQAARAAREPPTLPPYAGDDFGNIISNLVDQTEIRFQKCIVGSGLCGRVDPSNRCYGTNGACCVAYRLPDAPHIEDEMQSRKLVGFGQDQPQRSAVDTGWCAWCDAQAKAQAVESIACPGLKFKTDASAGGKEIHVPCASKESALIKLKWSGRTGESHVVIDGRNPCCNACAQLYRRCWTIKRGGVNQRLTHPCYGDLSSKHGQEVEWQGEAWNHVVVHRQLSAHSAIVERKIQPTVVHDLFKRTRACVCFLCETTFSSMLNANTGDATSEASGKHTKEAVFAVRTHSQCERWMKEQVKDMLESDERMSDADVAKELEDRIKVRAAATTPAISREWMLLRTKIQQFNATRVTKIAKPTVDESYQISDEVPHRFIFNFVRCSARNYTKVSQTFYSLNDMAFLASKMYKESSKPVVPGVGSVILIPDRYLKVGAARHSLVPSDAPLNVASLNANARVPKDMREKGSSAVSPRFKELAEDVNSLLRLHPENCCTILVDAPITLGGDVQHLIYAFSEFEESFWHRIFVLTKSTSCPTASTSSAELDSGQLELIAAADWRDTSRKSLGVVTCSVSSLMHTLKQAPAKLDHFDADVGKFLTCLHYEQYVAKHRGEGHVRHVTISTDLPDSQREGLVSPRDVVVSGEVIVESQLRDEVTRDIFVASVGMQPIQAESKQRGTKQRVFFPPDVLRKIARHRVDQWTLSEMKQDTDDDEATDEDDAQPGNVNIDVDAQDEEDEAHAAAAADDADDPPLVHAAPIPETLFDFEPAPQDESPSWGDMSETDLADLASTLTSEAGGA